VIINHWPVAAAVASIGAAAVVVVVDIALCLVTLMIWIQNGGDYSCKYE